MTEKKAPEGFKTRLTPEEQKAKSAEVGYDVDVFGRRKGGKPKGANNLVNLKKKLKHYVTENELKAIIKKLKLDAKSDKKVAMFLIEQIFGKARGTIGMDGGEDGKPILTMAAMLDTLERPRPIAIDYRVAEVEKVD